jgi:predicted RNA binding protein YcfA (HicA-like mRNA interferase family)
MLSFSQFLLLEDDDFPSNQKYLYGINHTDRDASDEILKLAGSLGYRISQQRGGHIQIHHPETGEHVTVVSMGTGGPKRYRDALKQIHDHQMSIGGFSGFEHDIKSIKKEMRVRELNVDDENLKRQRIKIKTPDSPKTDIDTPKKYL